MIETMENEKKDIIYFRNMIPALVCEYYEGQGIETKDIVNAPLNTWSACMRFVNSACINKADIQEDYIVKERGLTAKRYNQEIIEELCNIFLAECEKYDKVPSAWAFSLLCGIDRSTLEEWRYGYKSGGKVIPSRSDIMKKVEGARENSLANRLIDGRKNPMGALACLNFQFGWNGSRIAEERIEQVPSAAALPVFDGSGEFIDGSYSELDRPGERSDYSDALPVFGKDF